MTDVIPFFVVLGALSSLLASIAIWSGTKLRNKVVAVTIVAIMLPVGYASLVDLLSRPKPFSHEWLHRDLTQATVLGARLAEGESIFVWLELPGINEPRAYVLPWNEELAKQLHSAQAQAQEQGTEVSMRTPFKRTGDAQDEQFYAKPQEPLPVKQRPSESPVLFQQSTAHLSSQDALMDETELAAHDID